MCLPQRNLGFFPLQGQKKKVLKTWQKKAISTSVIPNQGWDTDFTKKSVLESEQESVHSNPVTPCSEFHIPIPSPKEEPDIRALVLTWVDLKVLQNWQGELFILPSARIRLWVLISVNTLVAKNILSFFLPTIIVIPWWFQPFSTTTEYLSPSRAAFPAVPRWEPANTELPPLAEGWERIPSQCQEHSGGIFKGEADVWCPTVPTSIAAGNRMHFSALFFQHGVREK